MLTSGAASPPDRWPSSVAEAFLIQERLRGAAVLDVPGPSVGEVRWIAGVDVSYGKDSDQLVAAAVVLDTETLDPVEVAVVDGVSTFPYTPGLLAFRELPSVIEALEKLTRTPDIVVCDGYGIAHPRRAGLAVHLGVLTGLPCFGVAKSPFTGTFQPPGPRRGDSTPLVDGDDIVGRALRTQDGVKPVFVSVGNAMGIDRACAHTLHLAPRYRLPETTRWADRVSRSRLRERTGRPT
ncbi:endonuclease V [Streptomyces sp. NBC_01190]|uniref:endonuclease V n=1 Tax=Streptomyces sp. NBC_01190 TaxID=2903767 RepID=UPI0038653BE0|nr:endonuclease V [Streptomyces sp. NBC_01190]